MFTNDKITEIFYVVHEFCNEFEKAMSGHIVRKDNGMQSRNRSFKLRDSEVFGKLFGDKGYISQTLFEQLFIDGIHLITKIRKNMKNSLMQLKDKIILRKRALILFLSKKTHIEY